MGGNVIKKSKIHQKKSYRDRVTWLCDSEAVKVNFVIPCNFLNKNYNL